MGSTTHPVRAIIVATLLALGTAVPSNAAVAIVAVPGSYMATYGVPAAVSIPDVPVTFANLDIQGHNVVSDATRAPGSISWCPAGGGRCPLFRAAFIDLGETAVVEGLESTPPGIYSFFCSPHPWMTGTLIVR